MEVGTAGAGSRKFTATMHACGGQYRLKNRAKPILLVGRLGKSCRRPFSCPRSQRHNLKASAAIDPALTEPQAPAPAKRYADSFLLGKQRRIWKIAALFLQSTFSVSCLAIPNQCNALQEKDLQWSAANRISSFRQLLGGYT